MEADADLGKVINLWEEAAWKNGGVFRGELGIDIVILFHSWGKIYRELTLPQNKSSQFKWNF